MRILSLFDGMACGMIAFKVAGIPIDSYDAYEIDKFAIQVATHNFPEIREHGDDISDQRTYSRIREKSLFIKVEGKDRREGALSAAEIEKLMTEGGWEDL